MYLSLILCIRRSQILINGNCLLSLYNTYETSRKPIDLKGVAAEKPLFPMLVCNEMAAQKSLMDQP